MAGEDPLDFRTKGSEGKEAGPYMKYLKKDALKGKRFGVPAFMLETEEDKLRPETRAMLMQAVEQMRAAGAVVVIDEKLLPLSFYDAVHKIVSRLYLKDGADQWISEFGPKGIQEWRGVYAGYGSGVAGGVYGREAAGGRGGRCSSDAGSVGERSGCGEEFLWAAEGGAARV